MRGPLAINKRKTLDAAQKLVRKGAYEKAYQSFNDYLKVEPRDAKVRLDLGQAYLKGGKTEKAIDTFLKVAEQWEKDGFDAKSVAVYKQILALDSTRIEVFEPLSRLYQHMGLNNEALKTLQAGAAAFQAVGKQREALSILRRVGQLDPSNVTARLKVAELLRREGMNEEAIGEYEEIASDLRSNGEFGEAIKVCHRILEIEPERTDTMLTVSRLLYDAQDLEGAQLYVIKVREVDPDHLEATEFLCTILNEKSSNDGVEEAYRQLANLYRKRGDEDKARDILQRFVTVDPLEVDDDDSIEISESLGHESSGTNNSADILLEDEELASLETDEGLTIERTPLGESLNVEKVAVSDDGGFIEVAEDVGPLDIGQALAEVKVYVRYKKTDKAIAILKNLIRMYPEEVDVIDELGQLYSNQGDLGNAQEQWLRALEISKHLEDQERVEHFEGRLGFQRSARIQDDGDGPSELEVDCEVDDEIGYREEESLGDFAFEKNVTVVDPEVDLDVDSDELEFEFDVDRGRSDIADEDGVAREGDMEEDACDDDIESCEFDLQIGVRKTENDSKPQDNAVLDAPSEADVSLVPAADLSEKPNTDSVDLQSDLELADFYYEQNLFDEARELYRKVLEIVPGHPQAQLRLGEINQARGADPSVDIRVEVRMEDTLPEGVSDSPSESFEIDTPECALVDQEEYESDQEEPQCDLDDGSGLEIGEADDLESSVNQQVELLPSSSDDVSDLFDLRAELSGVIQGIEDGAAPSHMGENCEESFDAIFAEFKKGVSGLVEEGDFQTHFDLGIAYRGMGLLEDAAREFGVALASSGDNYECIYMIGLCALDLERYSDAVSHFKQALSMPNVESDKQKATRFDLGRSLQGQGANRDALECFLQVQEEDPEFCDVSKRVALLRSISSREDNQVSGDEDEEYGETFDALIASAELGFDEETDTDATDPGLDSFQDSSGEVELAESSCSSTAPSEGIIPAQKRRRRKKTVL